MVTLNRIQRAKKDAIIAEFDSCKDLDEMRSKAFILSKKFNLAIQNVFKLMGESEKYNILRKKILNQELRNLQEKKSKYVAKSTAKGLQDTLHKIELTKRAIARVNERMK